MHRPAARTLRQLGTRAPAMKPGGVGAFTTKQSRSQTADRGSTVTALRRCCSRRCIAARSMGRAESPIPLAPHRSQRGEPFVVRGVESGSLSQRLRARLSIPWLPTRARSTLHILSRSTVSTCHPTAITNPQLLHAHATRTRAEIDQRTAPAHFAVHVALVLGEGRFQRMVHGDLPPTAARGQVESRLCRQVDRDRA